MYYSTNIPQIDIFKQVFKSQIVASFRMFVEKKRNR